MLVVSVLKNSGERRRVDASPVGQRSSTPQQTNGSHSIKKSLDKELAPFGKACLCCTYTNELSSVIIGRPLLVTCKSCL